MYTDNPSTTVVMAWVTIMKPPSTPALRYHHGISPRFTASGIREAPRRPAGVTIVTARMITNAEEKLTSAAP